MAVQLIRLRGGSNLSRCEVWPRRHKLLSAAQPLTRDRIHDAAAPFDACLRKGIAGRDLIHLSEIGEFSY